MNFLEFKQEAKQLSKLQNISRAQAHEHLARALGYKTYNSMLAALKVEVKK